jgi:hypothetical protein
VAEDVAAEFDRGGERIARLAKLVAVEHVLAELGVPASERELEIGERVGSGVRVGVEGGASVPLVARPLAERELLCIHRVAADEAVRRRVGG